MTTLETMDNTARRMNYDYSLKDMQEQERHTEESLLYKKSKLSNEILDASLKDLLNIYFTKKEQTEYFDDEFMFFLEELYKKDQSVIDHAKENNYIPTLTLNHSLRVAKIFLDTILDQETKIKKELDLTDDEIKEMVQGCIMHDIGKKFVANEILNKPSKLSSSEKEEMIEKHNRPLEYVDKLLESKDVGDDDLTFRINLKNFLDKNKVASFIIKYHHPFLLADKNYPEEDSESRELVYKMISCKIIPLIDKYDALISERSYKSVSNFIDPIEEIRKGDDGLEDTRYNYPTLSNYNEGFASKTLARLQKKHAKYN